MSNVINFTRVAAGAAAVSVSHYDASAAFLTQPTEDAHAVQFYDEDEFLFETVGHFLGAGLQAGDDLLVISTPEHRLGFEGRLEGLGLDAAMATGQVTFADAREMLSKIMVGTLPDPGLFRDMLERLLPKRKASAAHKPQIRAYGEMVDLLWRDGNSTAAIRLEELWNETRKSHSFSLLCAYVMGNFYREGDAAQFLEVCRNHSHVIPAESFTQLDDPHARLREISLLQQRARSLETEIQHRKELEGALRDALRERSRVEDELRACLMRETEARASAEASDAFKEVFLGILGHDLRNPLNTVLTTTRLMTMRGELASDSRKRLERVLSSGERMERMIDQILDVTRARLAGGLLVAQKRDQDLVPLVSKIVDEIRVTNPTRLIDFEAEGPCVASVDGDRFEQVVSNLLGNAVSHGDPDRSIRVVVEARNDVASVSVHNYGTPIAPQFMPLLFDPFKRTEKPRGRSDGLGLGLYISERIVFAHRGKIEVESSEATGTRFEAILPRRRHERGDGSG